MPFYIIQEDGKGYIKIGKGYAQDRIQIFKTGNPHDLTVLKQLTGGYREEKILHKLFFRERLNLSSEWFYPSEELLKFADLEDREIFNLIDMAEKAFSENPYNWDSICLSFKGDTDEDIEARQRKYAAIKEKRDGFKRNKSNE